jgi:hypothetical protein
MAISRDPFFGYRATRFGAAGFFALAMALAAPHALALSEIQREDVPVSEEDENGSGEIQRKELPPPPPVEESEPVPTEESQPAPPPADMSVPLPDPIVIPRDPGPTEVETETGQDEPVPEILYDVELLPEPVRRMRALIMEACASGDIERLRPLLSGGENGTQLSFGQVSGDPIEHLRSLSGDDNGHEILAILYEVLAAGYVRLDEGEPGEMYVWPYFFAVPLENLTDPQRVELFKLVTAGDYEDMKNFGAYIFYRIGISPEGRWIFFVAGD